MLAEWLRLIASTINWRLLWQRLWALVTMAPNKPRYSLTSFCANHQGRLIWCPTYGQTRCNGIIRLAKTLDIGLISASRHISCLGCNLLPFPSYSTKYVGKYIFATKIKLKKYIYSYEYEGKDLRIISVMI